MGFVKRFLKILQKLFNNVGSDVIHAPGDHPFGVFKAVDRPHVDFQSGVVDAFDVFLVQTAYIDIQPEMIFLKVVEDHVVELAGQILHGLFGEQTAQLD